MRFKPFKAFRSIAEVVEKTYSAPDETTITQTELYNVCCDSEFANNRLSCILGTTNAGSNVMIDFGKSSHLLIAGTTGSGKSVCTINLLTSLLIKNSPLDVDIYISDIKRVDYTRFYPVKHVKAYTETVDGTIKLLDLIQNIINDRLAQMRTNNVHKYREIVNKPVFVFIDEINYLLTTKAGKKEVLPRLERLLAISRASDVHFVLIGQNMQAQAGFSTALKLNINERICFHVMNKRASVSALEVSGAELLNRVGNGLYLDTFGNLTEFNGLYINDTQVDKIINHWKKQN